jgi:hypothetical protein
MYRVRFYKQTDNKSPISEFIENSSDTVKKKIIHQIRYLEEFGLNRGNPHLKKDNKLSTLGNKNLRWR